MALDVPAVLQPQRAEIVVSQLTSQIAGELVTELRSALVHELAVERGVLVHGSMELPRVKQGLEGTLRIRYML
jgi:6,7-dimethyl-8-ribityllumazine synthase